MADSLLLKSQANDVLRAIEYFGLDPAEFRWEWTSSRYVSRQVVSKLTHLASGFYFVFDLSSGKNHVGIFSPAEDTPNAVQGSTGWQAHVAVVSSWLRNLKREMDAPDLWAAAPTPGSLLTAGVAPEIANTPFTAQEQTEISERLKDIEGRIADLQALTREQAKFVADQFDYLRGALRRQGKTDWIHTTVGVLVTAAFSIGLGGEQARNLFQYAGEILGKFVQFVRALPSGR
jgi:hypothetical protein